MKFGTAKYQLAKIPFVNLVSDLCEQAGIEEYKTIRSLRATVWSLSFSKDVPDKLIINRTGHKNINSDQFSSFLSKGSNKR